MTRDSVLILGREDLIHSSLNKKMSEITREDFPLFIDKDIAKFFGDERLIIFVDVDGETFVIKNSYGKNGNVV